MSSSSKTNLLKPLTNVILGRLGQKITGITDHGPLRKSRSFLAEISKAYHKLSGTFKIKCFFFARKGSFTTHYNEQG